ELVSRKSVLERVYRHCGWRSPSRRGFALVDKDQLRRCDGEISRIRSGTDPFGKQQPVSKRDERGQNENVSRQLQSRPRQAESRTEDTHVDGSAVGSERIPDAFAPGDNP